MQRLDGALVLSASDLVAYLECAHLTELDRAAALGELEVPVRDDPELDLVRRRGEEHERAQLQRMVASGARVATIARPAGDSLDALRAAHARTVEAMLAGHDVIYQAAFFDGRWMGFADFLRRSERPSALGAYAYDVMDTKLARRVKASALVQLCVYAEQLEKVQGVAPQTLSVITGDRREHVHRYADFAAYYRGARSAFDDALSLAASVYPEPVPHCKVCRWSAACAGRRRADDHPSRVAFITRAQVRRLADAGISTMAELAASDLERVARIGDPTFARLKAQAALQARQRGDEVESELLPAEEGRGLALLPPPSAGDLFFDIEGDPFATDDGFEYLFGVVDVADGVPTYTPIWGIDASAPPSLGSSPQHEREAFERFVDLVVERLHTWPDMHVYHYAPYERTALTRLMTRHGSREEEIDRLLRAGVLVDLYQVVRQGVRVSQDSYSIKKIERLYREGRSTEVTGGGASIVAFERWLETGERSILDGIAAYNADDCESTWRLREWLEAQRAALESETGRPLGRAAPRDGEPSEAQRSEDAELAALAARLAAGVPDDPAARSEAQRATWLLAQLLWWHRREAKPEWWDFFHRLSLSDDELVLDSAAIGAITPTGIESPDKQSTIREYSFDPTQEHRLAVDPEWDVVDPRTGKGAGSIVALDQEAGLLRLRKGNRSFGGHPASLVPRVPVDTREHRGALSRLAEAVLEHGIDGPGRYRALRDFLLGRPPRIAGHPAGAPLAASPEPGVEAASRLAGLLDDTVLPVQGPPGTGKTYAGARMIVALLAQGKKVGVTAHTHRAIANLLDAAAAAAREAGVPFAALQKADAGGASGAPGVRTTRANSVVAEELAAGTARLVAGTSWLFARGEFDGALDVLVVDEAGQLSLANVLAVGTAARSMVLLGDPNQLAQPSRAAHPPGAEASALEHVLGEHASLPPERGLFLARTRRLHPELCRFVSDAFYDGRLEADAECALQRLGGDDALAGAGIRSLLVPHHGNRTTSPEEVLAVRELVRSLLGRAWTDRRGATRPLEVEDVLVVAPYNAHVARLRTALPDGLRVGTVDKFQGQQAPVVVFSMASSSVEDAPRGMEFLFDRNRLNVAISRAQGLAFVVASPALRRPRCHTPAQMRLANSFCRLIEAARPVTMA